MRFSLYLSLLALMGAIAGAIAGRLNTAFMINCGESCPLDRVLFSFYGFIFFPLAGFILSRFFEVKFKNVLALSFGLVFMTVMPFFVLYFQEIYYRYWELYAKTVTVDQEFSSMLISTSAITALNIADSERCAFGYARCEDRPRSIEAVCQGGYIAIEEKYWRFFKRLPAEDLGPQDERFKNFPSNVCRR